MLAPKTIGTSSQAGYNIDHLPEKECIMSKRKASLQSLSIDQLIRGKYQPRQHFAQDKLQELADSIQTTGGLIQPIVVRPIAAGQYEIVAGERRWRAAQMAGLQEINCLICDYDDEQALQAAIIENISRTDLNPIEEASAYQRLIDDFGYLHEEVAASVGRSRTAITNALRLLKLDAKVQEFIIAGSLSEGHGKILGILPLPEQRTLAEDAVSKNWNVRKLESAVKKLQQNSSAENNAYSDVNIQRLEHSLSDHLGNRVQIDCEQRGGGFLRIRFNNIDELEGHFMRIGFKSEI